MNKDRDNLRRDSAAAPGMSAAAQTIVAGGKVTEQQIMTAMTVDLLAGQSETQAGMGSAAALGTGKRQVMCMGIYGYRSGRLNKTPTSSRRRKRRGGSRSRRRRTCLAEHVAGQQDHAAMNRIRRKSSTS
jgi:hypothetical protein